jgi:DNA polymerase-3 subunit gamma/tau
MTYQVLYRAWRPNNFADLVGQEPIRRTLENALRQKRISHAYLFAGPRGTGKTSTARIMAMALNCAEPKDGQPCGHCESCLSIQSGNALDVLEIDAASNRGIEEIRELKEKMSLMSALGKYKVYIIDEVHMLTTEAFNALLKTLEEPPSHVVFILATTDVQKLPPTILSRCQRFDFRKIAPQVIRQRLKDIVADLQVPVEEEVYGLIIKRADGGLRDAISLLDQCLAFSPQGLDKEKAYQVLGLVQQESLQRLTQAIIDEDAASLFVLIDQMIEEGVEPFQILRDLTEYYRNLIMLQVCGGDTDLVLAGDEERQRMLGQGRALGLKRLQSMMMALETTYATKMRGNSRFMVEAILAGFMNSANDRPGDVGGAGSSRAGESKSGALGAPKPAFTAKFAATPEPAESTKPVATARPIVASGPITTTEPIAASGPITTTEPIASAEPARAFAGPDPDKVRPVSENELSVEKALPGKDSMPKVDIPAGSLSEGGLPGDYWDKILHLTKNQKIVLHAFLMASIEQQFKNNKLIILFDPEKGRFHKERSEESENRRILQEAAAQVLGEGVQIEYGFKSQQPETDPVKKAIAMFGEDIVQIKK